MDFLEKIYYEIEQWFNAAKQEGKAYKTDIEFLNYIKQHIDNLQFKIKKSIELTNKIIESGYDYQEKDKYAFQMLDILKEDK